MEHISIPAATADRPGFLDPEYITEIQASSELESIVWGYLTLSSCPEILSLEKCKSQH